MINSVNNRPIFNNTQISQNRNEKENIKIDKSEKSGRVEEIKNAIQNGTYKVDISASAKSIAKTLL